MEYLFVYGTLQVPKVQESVFGRLVTGTPDILDGFARSTIGFGELTYFIVVEQASASVEGLMLEITPEELISADRYETDAYRRFRVTLRSGKEVWVYGK
jgi:gamma-glutamylcyclotransferase (GGCT)/AIG2-like uncharacterized protein YtfP